MYKLIYYRRIVRSWKILKFLKKTTITFFYFILSIKKMKPYFLNFLKNHLLTLQLNVLFISPMLFLNFISKQSLPSFKKFTVNIIKGRVLIGAFFLKMRYCSLKEFIRITQELIKFPLLYLFFLPNSIIKANTIKYFSLLQQISLVLYFYLKLIIKYRFIGLI